MSSRLSGHAVLLRVLLIFAFFPFSHLHAQARHSADRTETISAFGSYSRVYTDYGAHDNGYTFGGDFTRNLRLISPSLEVRYTGTVGPAITESSFAGGLKAEMHLRRFHPYADALVGYGVIHFKNGPSYYTHDNSTAYVVGGGLDYRLTRSFAAKVDLQQQYWKLGQESSSHLTPDIISLGVTYTIPFGLARGRHYQR